MADSEVFVAERWAGLSGEARALAFELDIARDLRAMVEARRRDR